MNARNALVTGVTGSVGFAVAAGLARTLGADGHVYCQYRTDGPALARLAEYDNVSLVKIDFSDDAAFDALPDEVSVVVNSAGLPSGKENVATVPREEVAALLQVNLLAPFFIAQRFLPSMVAAGFGRIVNVNSIWGLRGSLRNGAYSMSKHGLSGLTKSIAKEYAGTGVTCNEICPGPVESDMMASFISEAALATGRSFEEVHSEWSAGQVGRRFVRPDEIVTVALMLCSDASSGVNGVSIPVDLGAIC